MALTCKSYLAIDYESEKCKRSSKGIPHRIEIRLEEYKDMLLQTSREKHIVEMNFLRLTKDRQMARFSMDKTGLSDLFYKMRVDTDRITCSPLMIDNTFL